MRSHKSTFKSKSILKIESLKFNLSNYMPDPMDPVSRLICDPVPGDVDLSS